ncbi:MAG: DUF4097 family beta strand repeat-containing protein [Acidobacteria bacterium]|nr:DUF4097 family beta strand repeat-containing protein [Acidobacteriota bacterium]
MSEGSTPTNPVTPQPAPSAPRRSFAGPLALILVGVVFLLANAGMLSMRMIGLWFANYWPVLLIIWGLHKVWEYQQAKQGGYAPSGIGFGSVFAILMIIVIGSMATGISRAPWDRIGDEIQMDGGDDLPFIFGRKYHFSETMEQAFPAGGSLRVASDRGNIQVVPGDGDKLRVLINKVVAAESQSGAESRAGSMRPTISVTDNVVTLNANTRSGAMNLEIQIPRKAAVDLMTLRGDIRVTDREGDVKAHTSRGDVTVEEVIGNARINMRRGDLRVSKVTGDVSAEGRGDETFIAEVGGSALLQGEYSGPLHFASIAKGMQFKSGRTNVEMGKLEGEITLESDNMHANRAQGPVKVLTRSYDIRLEDVSGDVRVENQNGEISLRPKQPGNIEITSRKGPIQVWLPSQPGFLLEATAERGDIESDFSELRIERQHRDTKASGRVGSGGPHVRLTTDRASIEIRKAN